MLLDGQRQWLTVIGGDHFYFKSHLAMDVARTIKRADVDRAALAAQPGVNAFDVRDGLARQIGWVGTRTHLMSIASRMQYAVVRQVELKSGARLRHITRADAQAQWWVRKLQYVVRPPSTLLRTTRGIAPTLTMSWVRPARWPSGRAARQSDPRSQLQLDGPAGLARRPCRQGRRGRA